MIIRRNSQKDTKYDNLLEIKNIWKILTGFYPLDSVNFFLMFRIISDDLLLNPVAKVYTDFVYSALVSFPSIGKS